MDQKWTKVSRAGFRTQIHAQRPGDGVWCQSLMGKDQISIERGARDGVVLVVMTCYNGEDRMKAWQVIKGLLRSS